jgi:hypothetical protein
MREYLENIVKTNRAIYFAAQNKKSTEVAAADFVSRLPGVEVRNLKGFLKANQELICKVVGCKSVEYKAGQYKASGRGAFGRDKGGDRAQQIKPQVVFIFE